MNDVNTENDELESLVGQAASDYTDRLNRGECVKMEEYVGRYPQIEHVLRQILPNLALIGKLGSFPKESASGPASAGTVPEFVGDYHIVREIGRGGMGVVYEAEQKSLGRRVALKVLPFYRLIDPLYLKRFQREAQAAARLHHTNIVPVFGVGEHEGIHFYAMQFIAGHGLDRLLKELRRLRQATEGTGTPSLAGNSLPATDSASGIARSFCTGQFAAPRADQISGAPSPVFSSDRTDKRNELGSLLSQSFSQHCRGVARLGLQVANALSYAHSQGVLHRDIKPSNLLLDAAGIVWVTDFGLAKAHSTEDLTHTGDLVGTLRYLAPERLAGQSDARSDIFSLGLTLYELLTLRPAYDEKTPGRLVQQVTAADPPPPRRLDRRIPSDLDTIIQKAIAKEPERRYATASELAGDLQCFLEDRPISARRMSRLEQAWRWCRRNPSITILSGGFLAALLIGLGASLWQWRLAEAQKQRAEANFQKARDAVDECFTTVTQDPALQEPGMEAARQVLFQTALKYYQDFLKQRADDAGIQADLARAYYRLGYITERIGSQSEALAAYEQACALFEKLAGSEVSSTHFRVELAQCYHCLGELQRVMGRSDLAETDLLRALAVREELTRSQPAVMDYQNDLADTHQCLGTLNRTTRRPAQAEACYCRAQTIREQIVREYPAQGNYRKALARDYSELSRLYAASSRPVEAEAVLRKAITTLEELTRDYPDVSDYQDSLATAHNFHGSFLLNSGGATLERIENAYLKALGIREQLVRDHPKVQEYQSELARVHNNLGLFQFITRHDDKAAHHYCKALALRVQLSEKHPDVVTYQRAAATTHHDLGLLFRRAGRWPDADRAFQQARTIQEHLLEQNREISDFAIELATTLNNLGLLARDQGCHQISIDWYTQASQDLKAVLKAEPQQTDARNLLAKAYAGRARTLTNLGRYTEALEDWDRSLEFTRNDLISGTRLSRAATLAHLGNYLEAVAEAERLMPPSGGGLVSLTECARVYAVSASEAVRDPKLDPAEKQCCAAEFVARSMELLMRGHECGEFSTKPEIASLKIDRDFDVLRSQTDFVRLLQKIEAGGKK